MPSPITTGGFQVTARPGIEYLDPRLLTPQYGSVLPAVGQGMGVASQFQQIQDEAKMRPIRAQLAQIQMQEAQDRMAQAPLQRRLKELQIQEAEQNASIPRALGGNVAIEEVPPSIYDMPALDDNGNRTGPVPMGDLVQITEEQLYGPGGIVTPRTVRKTVKTAAERVMEAEKQAASLEATKALATSRTRGKEFESTALVDLYNNAVAEGDTEAAQLYKSRFDALNAPGQAAKMRAETLAANPSVGFVDVKRGDRTFRQYFPKGHPDKILHEVDRGELSSGDILNFGGGVVNVAPGSGTGSTAGTDDIASLAKAFGAKGGSPNLAKPANASSFATPEEAAAAFSEGRIRKGDKIIVGGVSGTWK